MKKVKKEKKKEDCGRHIFNRPCECVPKPPQPIADWEKEFDENFSLFTYRLGFKDEDDEMYEEANEEVKTYIKSLLLSKEEEVIRKIKKRINKLIVKNVVTVFDNTGNVPLKYNDERLSKHEVLKLLDTLKR